MMMTCLDNDDTSCVYRIIEVLSPSMKAKPENCGGKMKFIFLDCSETLDQIKKVKVRQN